MVQYSIKKEQAMRTFFLNCQFYDASILHSENKTNDLIVRFLSDVNWAVHSKWINFKTFARS